MKKKLLTLGVLSAAWLMFWLVSRDTLDPDFGWHIRLGEIFVKSGIPVTDPFSYATPDYHYVDFEWLTGVLWYLAYPYVGLSGLAFIYGGLAAGTMWIVIPRKYKNWGWVPAILGWSVMLSRFSVRAQVSGWFFLAIILRLLSDNQTWVKWRWLFPLVMLIWTNMHGSFPLGLIAVGVWLAADMITSHKIIKVNIVIWFLGFAFTLINPYGFGLWREIIFAMSQSGLYVRTIAEWMPFYSRVDMGFLMAAVVVFVFGLKYRFRARLWEWIIMGLTFAGSLSSLRHVPVFMIASAGMVAQFIFQVNEKAVQIHPSGKKRFLVFHRFLIGIAAIICLSEITVVSAERLSVFKQESFYPVSAIKYLTLNSYPERLFSLYEWGGYLVWKLPERKIFIDGRMTPFLKKIDNGQNRIFEEYLLATQKPDVLNKLLDNYGVNTVLWTKTGNYRKTGFGEWIARTIFPSLEKNRVKGGVADWLVDSGWQKQYEDNVAVIFFRSVDK